jgi:chromosome segregation ATPase
MATFATVRDIITRLVDLSKDLKAQKMALQSQVIELTGQLSNASVEKSAIQNQLVAALANDVADAQTIAQANEAAIQAQQQTGLLQVQLQAAQNTYDAYVSEHQAHDAELEQQLQAALAALSPQ